MIVSLAQAKGIENVLLVFSHDYYDDEINELVQTIDFCKVIQIFYPFSIQTHSNEFPGESPGDCPRNINKEQYVSFQSTSRALLLQFRQIVASRCLGKIFIPTSNILKKTIPQTKTSDLIV